MSTLKIQQYQALRAAILQMEAENPDLHTEAGFFLGVSQLAAIEALHRAAEATKPEGLL